MRINPFAMGPGAAPELAEGSGGDAVSELQQELASDGFSPGAVDGDFGPGTRAAVEAFQQSRGLQVDGIVGPQTWAALSASSSGPGWDTTPSGDEQVSIGSSGPAVSQMQQLLTSSGFDCGGVDGDFGPNTAAALRAYQSSRGLEVDGVCGPQTWGALHGGAAAAPAPAPAPAPAAPPPPAGGDHPMLQRGAQGPDVSELQQLLNNAGIGCAVDGDFGPATQASVIRFQSSRGLGTDGVVGPQTWGALLSGAPAVAPVGNVSGDTRANILAVAQSQVGTPGDEARAKYPGYFGRPPESYCANFASWVLSNAGVPTDFFNTETMKNAYIGDGRWKGLSDPQPGDIVWFDWEGDGVTDHVGIVKGVNPDGSIETIEGNTGTPNGVWECTRSMNLINGFANPT